MKRTDDNGDMQSPKPESPQSSQECLRIIELLVQKLESNEQSLRALEAERDERSLVLVLAEDQADASRRLEDYARGVEQQRCAVTSCQSALAEAKRRLKQAEARESEAREEARLEQIQTLKDRLLTQAGAVDQAIVALGRAMADTTGLIGEIYNLMNSQERVNFTSVLSSIGLENAVGFHGLARQLGMHGIASHAFNHQSYVDYLSRFCARPNPAPLESVQPPVDSNRYLPEAEALSQLRSKVN
jgi:hypothetical protein